MSDLIDGIQEVLKAAPGYQKAEEYWKGVKAEVFATEQVAKIIGVTAGKFNVSMGRRIVTSVTDRLEITAIKGADDGAQTDVDALGKANQLDIEVPSLFKKAVALGDCYLSVWPDPDDDGNVDMIIRDPATMRAFYDEEVPTRLVYVIHTWLTKAKYRRATLYYGDRIERYISRDKESASTAADKLTDADFTTYTGGVDENGEPDPESWFESHEYGRPPIFHFRTERPYGRSELADVYGAQNILTKQIATMMYAAEGYGLPIRAALTKSGTMGTQTAAGGWDYQENQPGADGQLNTRRKGPRIKAKPGDLLQLEDVDSLVQLPPADVRNFIDPIRLTLELADMASGKNIYAHNASRADATGIAQSQRDKPLVKTVEAYQTAFGAELSDAFEFALMMMGRESEVTIDWAEAQLTDDEEVWTIATAKQNAGVPQERTLIEAGYPAEEVKDWAGDGELTNLEGRTKMVAALGTAMQQVGAASQFGMIDPAQAQAVFKWLLQAVTDQGAHDVPVGEIG